MSRPVRKPFTLRDRIAVIVAEIRHDPRRASTYRDSLRIRHEYADKILAYIVQVLDHGAMLSGMTRADLGTLKSDPFAGGIRSAVIDYKSAAAGERAEI